MSETYAGDPDNYPTSLTMPTDDDPPTEATFRPSLDGLADRTANLKDGDGVSFAGEKIFEDGIEVNDHLTTSGPINISTVATKRTLIMSAPTGASQFARLYSRAADNSPTITQGFDWTQNAEWTGTEWQADQDTSPARLFEFFSLPLNWATLDAIVGDSSLFTIRFKDDTSSNWAEDAWDGTSLSIGAGVPAPDDVVTKNTYYPKHFAKAWGHISTDGLGGITLNDGVGIDAVSISGGEIVVELHQAMANATYAPMLVPFGSNRVPNVAAILDSEFSIGFRDLANGAVDPAAAAVTVAFLVFGDHDV